MRHHPLDRAVDGHFFETGLLLFFDFGFVHRLDRFSYPPTLVAMMLGVISLGHMLKWSARDFDPDRDASHGPAAGKFVQNALLLMTGMAMIDLCWTILAIQAGVMREVNPLAAGLVHSPLALAAFKFTAMSVSFGIFFTLRERKRAQQATWWMCLICILVTFRWVVVDSLIG